MGLCTSGEIFQTKSDELLGNILGVKKYIGNVLVLREGSFYQHIDQIIVILSRLCTTGLKVNPPKCSFELKDITYLGYIITREGIKPDPEKLKRIMNIEQPTTH